MHSMRLSPLLLLLTFAAGCGSGDDSYTKNQDPAAEVAETQIHDDLVGRWETVATSADQYDGVLRLSAEGTFTEEDTFRPSGKVQKVEGTFTVREGTTGSVVILTVTKLDGNSVSGGPPIELTHDRKGQTLTNQFPGVVYARQAR